jgi:hypothetical protein
VYFSLSLLYLFCYIIFVNVCIILIFFIYTNITSLFVIIKKRHPRELPMEEDVVVQALFRNMEKILKINLMILWKKKMMLITQLKKMGEIS